MSYERALKKMRRTDASARYLGFASKRAEFSGQWGLQVAIAGNPNADAATLIFLSKSSTPKVRKAVARNTNTPKDILRKLASPGEELEIIQAALTNPNLPTDSWFLLLDSNVSNHAVLVFSVSNLPLEILEYALRTGRSNQAVLVASHPATPTSILMSQASGSSDLAVRLALAANLSSPSEALVLLAEEGNPQIALALANNVNISHEALSLLMAERRNHNQRVRELLRYNRRLTDEMLHALDNDPSWSMADKFDSEVERMFWDTHLNMDLEQLAGLDVQVKVGRYRLDFAITDRKIGIEIDGRAYHSSKNAFTHDRQRERDLELGGWRILRFSADEVLRNPDRCMIEAATWIDAT